MSAEKREFSYEDAVAIMPEVLRLTQSAVDRAAELIGEIPGDGVTEVPEGLLPGFRAIIEEWTEQIVSLGLEVKGLWLVDFDSGSGYYCWQYPEPALQHYHGYEEGFSGRVRLN